MENKYYVYAYLDTRKPGDYIYDNLKFEYEPFYIGKGQGNRLYSHLALKGKNYFKINIIKKLIDLHLTPEIKKIYTGLTNQESIKLEMEVINKIGRRVKNLGPLTNLTDGGEGHSGLLQSEETKQKRKESRDKSTFWETVNSEEFKSKMSLILKERFKDPQKRKQLSEIRTGKNNPMYGKVNTQNQKDAVKKAHADGKIKLSEEGRKKIIENNKKRKGKKNTAIRMDVVQYKLTSPDNDVYIIPGAKALQLFCSDHQIQFHKLKKNIGKTITENLLKSKQHTALNTLNWKIEYYEK